MQTSIPGTITKVETMADRGVRIKVDFQEMTDANKAYLILLDKKFGHFFFQENLIQEEDVKGLPALTPPKKLSLSQQLRLALMGLHMKNGGTKDDFESFYETQMKKLIAYVDEKAN